MAEHHPTPGHSAAEAERRPGFSLRYVASRIQNRKTVTTNVRALVSTVVRTDSRI
jgi:hypothetical protein